MTWPKRQNKYNATKQVGFDKLRYDSTLERDMADILYCLVVSGEMLKYQAKPPAVEFPCGIRWKVDFWCVDINGAGYYLETKGFATRDYGMKLRCFKHHKPAPLLVYGRKGSHWYIMESVNAGEIERPI